MRTREHDCGAGVVYRVESIADLEGLRPQLRNLAEPLIDIWQAPAQAFREFASRSTTPALTAWLERAASAACSLEVYDTELEANAYLRCDFGATKAGRVGTVLLDFQTDGAPRGCPSALKNAYSLLGGLRTQVGAAHFPLPPARLRPASRMPEIREILDPPSGAGFAFTTSSLEQHLRASRDRAAEATAGVRWWDSLNLDFDPSRYTPFFCSGGGDWLSYDDEGNVRWFGDEDGLDSLRATAATADGAVGGLFTALSEGRSFR